MYDASTDPYCYSGTSELKNLLGLRIQKAFDEAEAGFTAQRADEPLPAGLLSVSHYRSIHHHLFQDVYVWAGRYRTVRIFKDGSAFCYPENIPQEMRNLFADIKRKRCLRGTSREQFASQAAAFLSVLNAIHPFREGNGRTQTTFLALVADHAGHPLQFDRLAPANFLRAMVESFRGNEKPLERQISSLTK